MSLGSVEEGKRTIWKPMQSLVWRWCGSNPFVGNEFERRSQSVNNFLPQVPKTMDDGDFNLIAAMLGVLICL
jgi:hypothetical protein